VTSCTCWSLSDESFHPPARYNYQKLQGMKAKAQATAQQNKDTEMANEVEERMPILPASTAAKSPRGSCF